MTEEETKEARAQQLVADVDEAGKIAEEIKTKETRLKLLKEGIKTAAKGKDNKGQVHAIHGNLYTASVGYKPKFNSLTGIESDLDPVDKATALKLAPWDIVEPHKVFTGDQDAVKELKQVLEDSPELFKALFKHVSGSKERVPDKGEITKMARTDVKKDQPVRDVVLKFVKQFDPDNVNLKAKE